MAQRRMFSLKVIDTDLFLDMPMSARLLYYDLSMRADDDGFVAGPKKIQRMVGASEDDLKLLVAKQFIIPFESGICVIKHWRVHNYIQSDRYTPTFYKLEKSRLSENNNTYELMDTKCIQDGYKLDPQVRLGKDRLEIGKDRLLLDASEDACSNKLQPIIDKWNTLELNTLVSLNSGTQRYKMLNARIKQYGLNAILQAIENINKSSFLKGQNNRNWTITFDWFIRPNNFLKVLEGNYIDKTDKEDSNGGGRQDIKASKEQLDFSKYEG